MSDQLNRCPPRATLRFMPRLSPWITALALALSVGCEEGEEAASPPPPPPPPNVERPTEEPPDDGPAPAAWSEVRAISAGLHETCAVATDGRVYCWGSESVECGPSAGSPCRQRLRPVRVEGVEQATAVNVAGRDCAISSGGAVRCWGQVDALVSGPAQTRVAGAVPWAQGVDAIAEGGGRLCVLAEGTLRCESRSEPGGFDVIAAPGPVVQASVKSSAGCGVVEDGSVFCFGGPEDAVSIVEGVEGARQVLRGLSFTCARLADGTVRCWGGNRYGQLGDGTTTAREAPVAVSSLRDVTDVAVGTQSACAVSGDGSVRCWGGNSQGQLGAPPDVARSEAPRPVPGIDDAVSVSCGSLHCCALRGGHRATCWGYDADGQLGNGVTGGATAPADVLEPM